MKYKFDVKKVDLVNLNGEDYKEAFQKQYGIPFEKILGNLIYERTDDIDMADMAREIHKGFAVTVSDREKEMLEKIVSDLKPSFIARQISVQFIEIKEKG